MIEDRLLLWRFKCGRQDALCRIYEKYKGPLLKLAAALSHNAGAAEDIVQDVFVCFARSADRLKTGGNLRGYLATSVANRVRNGFKAKQSRHQVSLDNAGPAASDSKTPEQWVIFSEELRKVNDAVAQLPYEQREVVLLHVHGGMRFGAIARSQQVSVNTVLSRYRYAIGKLRSLLNSEVAK